MGGGPSHKIMVEGKRSVREEMDNSAIQRRIFLTLKILVSCLSFLHQEPYREDCQQDGSFLRV